MGIFLKITYQSQGGKTAEKAFTNQKVLSYIIDGLNDYPWQETISGRLTTLANLQAQEHQLKKIKASVQNKHFFVGVS